MRNLARVGARFSSIFKTEAGSHFRGTLIPASDQPGSPLDYLVPRLILRTGADCLVKAGDMILAADDRYLVGHHYSADPNFKVWALFKADRQMVWSRAAATTKDQLTGLNRASGGPPQDLGSIWVAAYMEQRAYVDPGLKYPINRLTIVSNQPIQGNDKLDGMVVTRVTPEIGLYIAEAE